MKTHLREKKSSLTEEVNPRNTLKKYWDYDSFRPVQEEIIQSILQGRDTFSLLPTGGGKSICFQVPAIIQDGLCLVISPLISLMLDQVADLKKRGIKALAINSSMHHKEIDAALDNAVYGNYKIVYVSPERIQTELFIERFKRMNVSFIAVDEAHCISQWGHDFRPSYLEIQQLRNIKQVPIIALTATATQAVVEDIVTNLELKDVQKFRKSFARDNIQFGVEKTDNKLNRVKKIIQNTSGSGIIYVRNRKKCQEISEALNAQGISSMFYHAGMDHDGRQNVQNNWMKNKCRVIVATNAFGMGIDKSDVRFVLHWDIPESLEAFYQEAGRAGRDGEKSISQVLYSAYDLTKLEDSLESTYPPMDEIKAVYKELALYYQLALGSGYMESRAFDLIDFCNHFKRPKLMVYHSLNQLEKEGLISLSSGFYQPSTIKISSPKNDLLLFQSQNPKYTLLIAYLLRAYSGIMEQDVKVDEREIARKTGIDYEKLIAKLKYLDSLQLIRYQQSSNVPSLTFLEGRLDISNLGISTKNYEVRKAAYKKRLDHMTKYVQAENQCRSRIILAYFDEENIQKECGHCDYCLSRSKKINSNKLSDLVLACLGKNTLSLEEICEKIEGFNESEILKACRRLCEDEDLIYLGKNQFKKP